MKNNEEKTLKDLRKKKDIIITKFDKGNGLVILNKSDYISKMNDILGTDKFSKLSLKENSKPLPMKNETELKNILKRLLKNKSIDQKFEKLLTCQGSQPAKLYGLTKYIKLVIHSALFYQ